MSRIYPYSLLLNEALSERGWEIIQQNDAPDQWLFLSVWTVRSVRACWGLHVHFCFINDPMPGQRGTLSEIVAYPSSSENTPIMTQEIGHVSLSRGQFQRTLHALMDALDAYRWSV